MTTVATEPNNPSALQLELTSGGIFVFFVEVMALVERAPSEQESFSSLSRTESSMSESSSERDAGEAGRNNRLEVELATV